jgi:ABC-2 type transport system permease protein
MSKTWIVAWREFKSTALTKAFILAAVLVPAMIIALGVLGPLLFNPQPPPLRGTIVFIESPDAPIINAAQIEFSNENILKRIRGMAQAREDKPSGLAEARSMMNDIEGGRNPRSMSAVTREFEIALTLDTSRQPSELEDVKAMLARGELVAIVTTLEPPPPPKKDSEPGADSATQPEAASASQPEQTVQPSTTNRTPATRVPTVYVPSSMNVKHTGLIEDLVQASTARARIEAAGLDVQTVRDLARAPDPNTVRISKEGLEKSEGKGTKVFKMMLPMGFMMLIWIGAFVSANYLLTTTIEEKSNKVMEVLLSAVSPMQLMGGKIIGQALVGMVMVGMYLAMAIAGLTAAAAADLIEWQDLIYFALFYIMAYFMIASIMAAIGSAVNELREAQSLMTPAMLLLMIPLMLWLPISDSPNGTLATVTSFIPPLIPFVMILRVTGGEPIAQWQIIASLVVGFGSMFGMIWMAAKIFRIGVLMYGKPPSPLELIKWLRYE